MKRFVYFAFVVSLLCVGCSKKQPPSSAKPATNPPAASGNPLTAPVDYLGVVGKAQKSAVRVVDTAQIKQAIAFFHANEDRYPETLNELVTKRYLARLPTPPYGMKFDYNPKTGEFKILRQ
jgi:hypothetical protein